MEEAYDDFSCNLNEDGKPVPPIPPLKTFYHGNITARDAKDRLKQSKVGSYLVRLNNQSGKGRDFNYMISYAIISSLSSSTPGSIQVLHRGLEIEIGSEHLIPKILRKQDPTGKKFVIPLYPPLYPLLARNERKQEEARKKKIFNCLECDFNSVVKKDFVTHFNRAHEKQDEKNLIEKGLKKKRKYAKYMELKIQNTLSSYGIINQNEVIVDVKLKNDDIDNIIVF